MSIVGSPNPYLRQRLRYVSESESSVTSTVSLEDQSHKKAFLSKLIEKSFCQQAYVIQGIISLTFYKSCKIYNFLNKS